MQRIRCTRYLDLRVGKRSPRTQGQVCPRLDSDMNWQVENLHRSLVIAEKCNHRLKLQNCSSSRLQGRRYVPCLSQKPFVASSILELYLVLGLLPATLASARFANPPFSNPCGDCNVNVAFSTTLTTTVAHPNS